MRLIGWLLLVLMGLCWLASEVSLQTTETLPAQWRRTVDGWELKSSWARDPSGARPATVHPAVIATLQILLAVAALIAFSNERGKRPSHARKTPAADPCDVRRSSQHGSYRFLHMKRSRPITPRDKFPG